jgi:hypothetical protein
VLSSQEQQIWDDVQRFWAEEVEEPTPAARRAPHRSGRASHDRAVLQVAVVIGSRITVVLLLLGALVPGLAVGLATALGWALSHSWPRPSGQGAPGTLHTGGGAGTAHRPADQPGHRHPGGTENAG